MESLRNLLSRLEDERLSLLILKDGAVIYSSRKGGIAPLLDAIEQLGLGRLSKSMVVDKIVGKAAALLIGYFKAEEVFAKLMSTEGARILSKEGIRFFSEETVQNIKNRDGTGICPFETLVLEVEDPQEAYRLLRRTRPSSG